MNLENLESVVHKIDPALTFLDFLGKGGYARVAKVSQGNQVYALKIPFRAKWCLGDEFEKQKSLEHIEGIPKTVELYDDAFLMEFVEGTDLHRSLKKLKQPFIDRLWDIVTSIKSAGYVVQQDLYRNVIIDSNEIPWVIDFHCARKAKKGENVLRHNHEVMRDITVRYLA